MRWKIVSCSTSSAMARADLESAGAGADQGEPLPRDIQVLGPAGRVERRSGEGVHARDVGHPGDVERAHGADDEAGLEHLLGATGRTRTSTPTCDASSCHATPVTAVSKRQCGRSSYLSTMAVEVRPQLRLLAVVLAPEVGRLEGEAVLVAPDVDACPGVTVLPPGAAGPGVLVDDGEGQARLLEPDAGQDPAHAAADDDDR